MDESPRDSPQDKPAFTVDEASGGAGTEKPSVAADEQEQDGEGLAGLQQQAPDDFAVQDAVVNTAHGDTEDDKR